LEKSRRHFLKHSSLGLSGAALFSPSSAAERHVSVVGEIGVTTGSFFSHITFGKEAGKISMLDLPKVMDNELDMKVIDFMSRTLESFEPAYLEKLRSAVVDNHCIATNLKCNQKGMNMASPDKEVRQEALRTYKESIDAAEFLGCRWIRPVAGGGRNPDRQRLVESFRELIDYGAAKGVSVLIENTGWVAGDPNAIPELIAEVGEGLDASPDTGNWENDEIRYSGLTNAYPLAVTSDFKAFQLEPDDSHPKYDLKKCFDAGWEAGFRGPWCIEHFHTDLTGLIQGFGTVRDRLRGWIAGE
tara:strand:+ start:1204 stop:2103 length:900 start_codon:yes stop_codon:yes gene_type:complete